MAKFYDISKKITNELPTLKITEDLICTVNNRQKNILNVQAMIKEAEKKAEEAEKEGTEASDNNSEFVMMGKALELLVGKKAAKAIDDMDLPINEFTMIFRAVMSVAQGKDLEEEPETP